MPCTVLPACPVPYSGVPVLRSGVSVLYFGVPALRFGTPGMAGCTLRGLAAGVRGKATGRRGGCRPAAATGARRCGIGKRPEAKGIARNRRDQYRTPG
ncbi:hypothetical protein GCM10027089_14280 [Nocardia thraciensis]